MSSSGFGYIVFMYHLFNGFVILFMQLVSCWFPVFGHGSVACNWLHLTIGLIAEYRYIYIIIYTYIYVYIYKLFEHLNVLYNHCHSCSGFAKHCMASFHMAMNHFGSKFWLGAIGHQGIQRTKQIQKKSPTIHSKQENTNRMSMFNIFVKFRILNLKFKFYLLSSEF